MKIFFCLVTLCLLSLTSLIAQPTAYHTTLFDKLNPATGGGRYSALWGYTAPNGREYALLGGPTGTHIIDITDKPIKQVAFIAGPQSGWREMKTFRNYAYVVSEGGSGLQIIDLSQLPTTATLVKADTSVFRTGHTISQTGNYIYVNGSNTSSGSNGGTLIFDVATNPTSPKLVGTYSAQYVHDAIIYNDTMYSAEINIGQLSIVYIGDKAKPSVVAQIRYPGAGTHNSDLTQNHNYLMTTDEIGSTPKTLKVWSIADRNNISKVMDYTPVPGQIIHNVHTKGRLAVVAWYTAGTRILDMTDPLDPAEVGFYDTFPGAGEVYSGNWETYPYFPSGKIISSDMQTGLYVFTFDGAQRGSVSGRVLDASTNQPIKNATITLTALGKTVTTDSLGRYRFAGATDTLDFSAAAQNYFAKTGKWILTPSGTVQDILLSSMNLADLNVHAVDINTNTALPIFSYRVIERNSEQGITVANPKVLTLPRDSAYTIYVGAWGYLPQSVPVTNTGQTVEVKLQRGYADDAELELGWTLSATGDTAAAGFWQRGVPIETSNGNTVVQTGTDHTAGFGNDAFITGLADGGAPGGNDIDNGQVSLTSPPMDLRSYNDPRISCWLWYSRDAFPDPNSTNDTLLVLISNDNGATWNTLERITASPQQWQQHTYRIKDFVTPGAQTLFRVVAADVYVGSWVEAGLDDFLVTDVTGVRSQNGIADQIAVRISPNPVAHHTRAQLSITTAETLRNAHLQLFDPTGTLVADISEGTIPAGSHTYELPTTNLPTGAYTWRVVVDGRSVVSGKHLVR